MNSQNEIYVILSQTQPEIVDFTYYTEKEAVEARVINLNKLARKAEYWYITLYLNHRNSENDGENGYQKISENLVPQAGEPRETGGFWEKLVENFWFLIESTKSTKKLKKFGTAQTLGTTGLTGSR